MKKIYTIKGMNQKKIHAEQTPKMKKILSLRKNYCQYQYRIGNGDIAFSFPVTCCYGSLCKYTWIIMKK